MNQLFLVPQKIILHSGDINQYNYIQPNDIQRNYNEQNDIQQIWIQQKVNNMKTLWWVLEQRIWLSSDKSL
jgi:hypothetical protein